MSCDKDSLLLYAVTDRAWLGERELSQDVEQAIMGGATMVQLREKKLLHDEFLSEAFKIKELCKSYKIPFIINDDLQIAMESDADGIHVGQSDMAALKVRQVLGKNKIIGVSAQTVEQAIEAEKSGADYLGVGAVFTTSTKKDADFVPFSTLRDICQSVSIPVVAIGGIYDYNIEQLKGSGICGVAVVSSLFAEGDIRAAAEKMRTLAEQTVGV